MLANVENKKEHQDGYKTHNSLFDANFQSPAWGSFDPPPCSHEDTDTSGEWMDPTQEEAHRTALTEPPDELGHLIQAFVPERVDGDHLCPENGNSGLSIEASEPNKETGAFPPMAELDRPPEVKGAMTSHATVRSERGDGLDYSGWTRPCHNAVLPINFTAGYQNAQCLDWFHDIFARVFVLFAYGLFSKERKRKRATNAHSL
jgi:hypothetical protein